MTCRLLKVLTQMLSDVASTLKSLLVACAVALPAHCATAQTDGDARQGLASAQSGCTGCHAVLASETYSPNPLAPTFVAIANTRGMTETALVVWFRTPHPTMPNLIIKGEEMADLIAYIVSLREKP